MSALLAVAVVLLPVTGAPAEGVRAAQETMARALPAPFAAAPMDVRLFEAHLAALGATCRGQLTCVCTAAGLSAQTPALDVEVARLSAKAWAVDVRLVAPCEDAVIDRRAMVVEASPAALTRFVSEAVAALLRGRDR